VHRLPGKIIFSLLGVAAADHCDDLGDRDTDLVLCGGPPVAA
jgi:hypothetical protein